MNGVELLKKYFPALNGTQTSQFQQLLPLYKDWNEKINVISRKDIDQLYERHVLHSLGIAKVVSFAAGACVIDVGTGGGFPGIPLAIFFPEVQFHLVDSIGKKIRVVSEISAALDLKNVTAEHGRVEAINQKFDFAVSRAVAPLSEMVSWLKPMIRKGDNSSMHNGMFFLKGGDLTSEIRESKNQVMSFDLSNFFEEEFFEEKKVLYIGV
jgi:16S rRNA (guanine527-N7)-methyltransferase